MIIAIGEILFDIFPDDKRLGGAPFNYSFHLKKMGAPVVFISRIGNDDEGRYILNFMQHHEFSSEFIQIDETHETGKVMVELNEDGSPEFNLIKNAAYDHIEFRPEIATLFKNDVDLIYFGSVIQRTKQGAKALEKLLSFKDPKTKCFCDINLRPGCYDKLTIRSSLAHADILKLNMSEVKTIKEMTGGHGDDDDFIRLLMTTYGIETVSLTMGASGSVLYSDSDRYEVRIPETKMVINTVGAGDAYAAMFSICYLRHWPPERIVSTASNFASRTCSIAGAIPSSTGFYDDFIEMLNEEDRNGK